MLEKLQGEKNKNAAPRHLLWTRWRVLKRIDYLPRFHGILWSSMLRYGYNPFLRPGRAISRHKNSAGDCPIWGAGLSARVAADPGIVRARIRTGAAGGRTRLDSKTRLGRTVTSRPGLPFAWSRLPVVFKRRAGLCTYLPHLHEKPGTKPIASLCKASAFQLQFKAPLRLKRPSGCKTSYAVYCDPDWYADDPFALAHLLDQIAPGASPKIGSLRLIKVTGEWLSLPYGDGKVTPLGGFIGTLWLEGRIGPEFAWRLIRGQYTGIGKNRAFGFGLYHIPEIAAWLPLANASALTKPRPRIIVGTAPAGQKMIGLSA